MRPPHLLEYWRALDRGDLARVLTLDPDQDPHAWHLRALALLRSGRHDDALLACDRALAIDPLPGPLLTRGLLHCRRGAPMTALEDLRRARRLTQRSHTSRHLVRAAGGADLEAPLMAEVVDLFDRYAPAFDAHLVEGLKYKGHIAVPALALKHLPSPHTTWDLGCGSGLCAPSLRPHTQHLIGVDASSAMVQVAAQRGYDQLWADDLVHALAFAPDHSADLLLSADVLGYLGPLDAVFEQAARVLRPGGAFVFSVEASRAPRFTMQPSRRCAYHEDYLFALGETFEFSLSDHQELFLRQEATANVPAHIFCFLSP